MCACVCTLVNVRKRLKELYDKKYVRIVSISYVNLRINSFVKMRGITANRIKGHDRLILN